jgi:hypothetical protein
VNEGRPIRLALDQNFPTPLIRAVATYLPDDVEVSSLHQIDRRLSDLDDRSLLIALRQVGWDGLITNNYKMLAVPQEIAAIIKTRTTVVAVEGLGHDPLRAVGALMLELPGLASRLVPNRSNVFRLAYRRRTPEDAWDYLRVVAERAGRTPEDLWNDVGVSNEELETRVLD